MTAQSDETRPLQRAIGVAVEAGIAGLLIVLTVAVVGWFRGFGKTDYMFLIPAAFLGGAVVYAAGEAIAGRLAGSFVGALLCLWAGEWIGGMIGRNSIIEDIVGPSIGLVLGAVIGAFADKVVRGSSQPASPQDERPHDSST